jgi:UDP-N-acetylglucosamine 2-epimerase
VLEHYRARIDVSTIVGDLGLEPQGYFLVSAHREENVDNAPRLRQLLECLEAVRDRWGLPIIVSTHPRTRKRLEGLGDWEEQESIRFLEPFGFHDYNKLQLEAKAVLSDSGTISEEASILGFPAVTLRDSIERPEALDAGAILMTGLAPADVVQNAAVAIADPNDGLRLPPGYEVSDTSRRAVRFMLSTASKHHSWAGIRP